MFKVLLTINAILAFVSGAVCALIPRQLLAHYDVSLSPMGLVIYQFWGVALIGLGMLTWFLRNITEVALQKRIGLALLITNGLSVAMAIRGQFAGANSSGWSTVVLFFLLTLCWGIFLLIKPPTVNKTYERHDIR
ncbi:MAG: hypothetical protein P8179_17700 [Candidatus Thiodiazotropha sp.]